MFRIASAEVRVRACARGVRDGGVRRSFVSPPVISFGNGLDGLGHLHTQPSPYVWDGPLLSHYQPHHLFCGGRGFQYSQLISYWLSLFMVATRFTTKCPSFGASTIFRNGE